MWIANIINKRNEKGVYFIDVEYANGANKVIDSVDMTGGSADTLNTKISQKINTLNSSDSLDLAVSLGQFNPVKTVTSRDTFSQNLRKFQSIKRAVDLGLVSSNDKFYTDAETNMKNSFDPLFIDLI